MTIFQTHPDICTLLFSSCPHFAFQHRCYAPLLTRNIQSARSFVLSPVIDVRPPAAENPDPVNLLAFICLWADPADQEQEVTLDSHGFGSSARGGGTVIFGHKAVDDFLCAHGFSHIFRAHEATASGIAVSKGAKVITVFSTSKDHGCGSDAVCGCVLVGRSGD